MYYFIFRCAVPTTDSLDVLSGVNSNAVIGDSLANVKTEIRNAGNIVCVDSDIREPALDEDGHIACDHDVIMSQKEWFLSINNACDNDFKTAILKHKTEKDNAKQHGTTDAMLPPCHTGPMSPTVCLIDVRKENRLCSKCVKECSCSRDITDHIRGNENEIIPAPSRKSVDTIGEKNIAKNTAEQPQSCVLCNKRFVNRHKLKRHIMTHTGEKPHFLPSM